MSVVNGAFTRTNSFGSGEERNYPRFFTESVQDEIASQREGRPIFRDEERVEIIMPGNPHTRPVQRVGEEQRQRWPKEYEAFKRGLEMSPEGTPLEEWPILKRAHVLELKALGFLTVEQVARMDDHAIQRIGIGGRHIRERALAFLDDAERNKLTEQLAADKAKLESRCAELESKTTQQGELIDRLFAEVQAMKNAPNPIAAARPSDLDPVERSRAAQAPTDGGQSSLAGLASRKRGRPAREETGLPDQAQG